MEFNTLDGSLQENKSFCSHVKHSISCLSYIHYFVTILVQLTSWMYPVILKWLISNIHADSPYYNVGVTFFSRSYCIQLHSLHDVLTGDQNLTALDHLIYMYINL